MRILVTGGLGYTGIELTKKLAEKNHEIFIVDIDLYKTYKFIKKYKNVYLINRDVRFINWNILDELKIDVVYHLAGISNDPGNGVSDSLGLDINLYASINLYKYLENSNVKTFIYPSSCSIYGNSTLEKIDENTLSNPITNYAYTKAKFEEYIKENLNKNITTVIIRPATVYGPSDRLRLDLLINKLLVHGMARQAVSIPNLNNCRPHLYIKDLIDIYLYFLSFDKKGLYIYNAAFNNLKISEIVNIVSKITSSKLKVVSEFENDKRSYHIDSSKITNLIPKLRASDTTENLLETMKFFKSDNVVSNMNDSMYFNKKIQAMKWGLMDE